MSSADGRIDRWLFRLESPHCLGLLRILLVAFLTTQIADLVADVEAASDLPVEFMEPGPLLRWHPLPFPMPGHWVGGFQTVMVQLGVLASLGFLTRATLFLFAAGYAYLTAVQSAWGWHDHGPSLVVQVLLVAPFLPGITSLSIDNLRQHVFGRRGKDNSVGAAVVGAPVPRWGLQLVLVLVATFYFASGLAKVRTSGIEWMDGHTLSFYMSGNSVSSRVQQLGTLDSVADESRWKDGVGLTHYLYGARPSPLAKAMADIPALMIALSIATIVLELCYPLILAGGATRALLLLSGMTFHLSIFLMMGISFFPWVIIDFCLVDWPALGRFVRTRTDGRPPGSDRGTATE